MPVKRRTAKRRASTEREFEVWSAIFDGGYDFFDELPEIGLPFDGPGQVPLDLAQEPWRQFGERYLAEHPSEETIWAEQQFGRPWEN